MKHRQAALGFLPSRGVARRRRAKMKHRQAALGFLPSRGVARRRRAKMKEFEMKSYVLVLMLFLLLVVSGCQSASGTEHAPSAKTGLHVIFLYDQSTDNTAADDYLDALLNIVNHHPLKRRQITIQTGKKDDLTKKYELQQTPALIVKNDGFTKMRIEGQNNKNDITKRLAHIIEQTKTY
jgi:hypothetical protein